MSFYRGVGTQQANYSTVQTIGTCTGVAPTGFYRSVGTQQANYSTICRQLEHAQGRHPRASTGV